MDNNQIIESVLKLEKRISIVERTLRTLDKSDRLKEKEYLTPEDVKRLYNKSATTLRRYRKNGLITDYRMTVTGRGFSYSANQCEKVFRAKIKSNF